MATRRDYRCPGCGLAREVQGPLLSEQVVYCEECGEMMGRYFGNMGTGTLMINFGYRENRYSNETDANIAKYRFEHL